MHVTYLVPLKKHEPAEAEFFDYLRALVADREVILVDASAPAVFAQHARLCDGRVRHVRVHPEWRDAKNGKVAGVLTGLQYASHDTVVIADDDVRYDREGLNRVADLLESAEVVRPQNYFDPVPWHARMDTARTLLNRVSGGDWPGTLGIRRSALKNWRYDPDVLFENLELVRTIEAGGGVERCPLDLYVRRIPPSSGHFWSQRIRQAYDEFARPIRMICWLSVGPLVLMAAWWRRWKGLAAGATLVIALAEFGRMRAGGRRVFPFTAALLSPVWLVERAMCAWLALGSACLFGGVPYNGRIIAKAASSRRTLRVRTSR